MFNYCLLKVGFSHALRHPLQSVLLITGIALGVALVVAVDLVNGSAGRSLAMSAETLLSPSTHRIRGAPGGFDELVYARLESAPELVGAAPYVDDFVNVPELGGRPVRLVGIDPFAMLDAGPGEGGFMSFLPRGVLNGFISEPGTALISEDLAEESGTEIPGTLTYVYGNKTGKLRIIGVLDAGGGSEAPDSGSVILADISTAQEALGRTGLLTRIDLFPAEGDTIPGDVLRRISETLPPGVSIAPVQSFRESVSGMTRSFELNLLALSLLALFVGLFLIYNTVTFSVLRRRSVFGTLRSIGATPAEIFKMVIAETIVFGLTGSLAGIALGILLGSFLMGLVTGTVSDLYYTLTASELHISPFTLARGLLLGILASVASGLVPSFEASRVRPVGALRRSGLEGYIHRHLPHLSLAGGLIIAAAVLLLQIPSGNILLSLASLFLILTGGSLLVPLITKLLMSLFALFLRHSGAALRMAPGNVVRSISRTGVAIASLTVAVSVLISVAVMIGSFRATVVSWLDYTLNADVFVSLDARNTGSLAGLDPDILQSVRQLPGVDRVATGRNVLIETPGYGPVNLLAVTRDIGAGNRKFVWTNGNSDGVWTRLEEGSVLVSESFANLNGIKKDPAVSVLLDTDYGERAFDIAGAYYDYGYQRGVILMADSVYRDNWNDRLVSSLSVYAAPGVDAENLLTSIRENLAGRSNLVIRSDGGLKKRALLTFDRTFEITRALRVLVAIVAFIGVFSSLMSLQLERVKEFGVLKALGMTSGSLTRMSLLENFFIGITAGVLSVPLGLALSLILVYEVNLRSFGWSLDFVPAPPDIYQALLISVAAALCAGIYPAYRISSRKTAGLVREE